MCYKTIAYNSQIGEQKVLQFMAKYTEIKVIMISDIQHKTLVKMKSYNIDVCKFIRDAIYEKIKKEHKELIFKQKKQYCPFSNNTIEL